MFANLQVALLCTEYSIRNDWLGMDERGALYVREHSGYPLNVMEYAIPGGQMWFNP